MHESVFEKIKRENILGYWDKDDLIYCSVDDIPDLGYQGYLQLKCEICGREYYKRLDRLLGYCRSCGRRQLDLRDNIKLELSRGFDLVGYTIQGKFIEEYDPNKLPIYITWTDSIELKCKICGTIFSRGLKHLGQQCPKCFRNSLRTDWIEIIKDSPWNYDGNKILGYIDDNTQEFIECSDLDKFPTLGYHSYIRVQCAKCGRIGNKRVDMMECMCPVCSKHVPEAHLESIETRFGLQYYQSSYEKEFIEHCVENKNVTEFQSQPDIPIPYDWDGEFHVYYPDAILTYKGNKFLVEIKPEKLVNWDVNQLKIAAGKSYCNDHNMKFVVLTEIDLFDDEPFPKLTI